MNNDRPLIFTVNRAANHSACEDGAAGGGKAPKCSIISASVVLLNISCGKEIAFIVLFFCDQRNGGFRGLVVKLRLTDRRFWGRVTLLVEAPFNSGERIYLFHKGQGFGHC